jgi:hypothetical protein
MVLSGCFLGLVLQLLLGNLPTTTTTTTTHALVFV